MSQNDNRIIDRLNYLKEHRWPKSVRVTEQTSDLSGDRIDENKVETIDEFEQCWTETYHTTLDYDYLNHLISGAVAFEIKRIARDNKIMDVEINQIDEHKIVEMINRDVEYAIRMGDIESYDELFVGAKGET